MQYHDEVFGPCILDKGNMSASVYINTTLPEPSRRVRSAQTNMDFVYAHMNYSVLGCQ
jgi:hypothetical protein